MKTKTKFISRNDMTKWIEVSNLFAKSLIQAYNKKIYINIQHIYMI